MVELEWDSLRWLIDLSRFYFCRLNILEVTGKTQANAEESNLGLSNVLEEHSDDKKATIVKKGRQAKKLKLETESHNIKDMFSRATRRKN